MDNGKRDVHLTRTTSQPGCPASDRGLPFLSHCLIIQRRNFANFRTVFPDQIRYNYGTTTRI